MAVTSGFYNAVLTPGTGVPDRLYDAVQISSLFDGIVRDGVFMSIGGHLAVSANAGMQVQVASGRAWFKHSWLDNDAAFLITVDAAEVLLNRIDAIVVDVDSNQGVRANTIKVVKGTPASTPVNPSMANESRHHQYPLAYVYVGHDVTEIVQANITNAIGTTECPFITGILETVTIDAIVAQWSAEWNDWTLAQRNEIIAWKAAEQGEFTEWFDLAKGQLSSDPAGNLQNQIYAHNHDTSNPHAVTANQVGAGALHIDVVAPTSLDNLSEGYDVGAIWAIAQLSQFYTFTNIAPGSLRTLPPWTATTDIPPTSGNMVTSAGVSDQGVGYVQMEGTVSSGHGKWRISHTNGLALTKGHKYYVGASLCVPVDEAVQYGMAWIQFVGTGITGDGNSSVVVTHALNISNPGHDIYNSGRIFTAASTGYPIGKFEMLLDLEISSHAIIRAQGFMILDLTNVFGAGNEPGEFFMNQLLSSPAGQDITNDFERYFITKTIGPSTTDGAGRMFTCIASNQQQAIWAEFMMPPYVGREIALTAETGFTLAGTSKAVWVGKFVYFEIEIVLATVRAAGYIGRMVNGLPPPTLAMGFEPVVMSTARLPVTGAFRSVLCGGNTGANTGLWFNAITATTANQILSVSGWYRAAE